SRRARTRLAVLGAEVGAGGQWLAVAEQHDAILREATGAGYPEDELAKLTALVDASPGYPRAEEARMWIGDTYMRVGQPDHALAAYRAALAIAPDDAARFRAAKSIGDALAATGDLDGAEAQ